MHTASTSLLFSKKLCYELAWMAWDVEIIRTHAIRFTYYSAIFFLQTAWSTGPQWSKDSDLLPLIDINYCFHQFLFEKNLNIIHIVSLFSPPSCCTRSGFSFFRSCLLAGCYGLSWAPAFSQPLVRMSHAYIKLFFPAWVFFLSPFGTYPSILWRYGSWDGEKRIMWPCDPRVFRSFFRHNKAFSFFFFPS